MEIPFYQTIPILGVKGRMNTPEEFERIGLPEDLTDADVLDIGCNMGAFLFEAKKRGAKNVLGVEVSFEWRVIANGLWRMLCEIITYNQNDFSVFRSVPELLGYKLFPHEFDLVLLLSVTHVTKDKTGQEVLDEAWSLVKSGGLLIVEINDRLQEEPIKLPEGAELVGKNKDNRSVWHCHKV